MARFDASLVKCGAASVLSIPAYEQADSVTIYVIKINLGHYNWTTKHRYSEFYELNEKLVGDHGIDRHLLPRKKLFGNQSESFVQRRQMELELYLQMLLLQLTPTPAALAQFLDFHKYEIQGISHALAEELFQKGDVLLQSDELFQITPLQLNAVTGRLKLPVPTCASDDRRHDLGHVLDFFSQVRNLRVCGSDKAAGTSNIVPNDLPFDLCPFKALLQLQIDGCNPFMVHGLEMPSKTVNKIMVHDTVKALKDLLLADIVHRDSTDIPPSLIWHSVSHADFSYNQISSIDDSIWLFPNVTNLDMSYNQISSVEYMDRLTRLSRLDLSHNRFVSLPPLHTRLGNIVTLNLSGNSIKSLNEFSKLYSLVSLDLTNNQVANVNDLIPLNRLPCLETLTLSGNLVTHVVDYRTRALEHFNSRASEIILDGEHASQQELDTVAVLQALRRAKDGGHDWIGRTRNAVRNNAAKVVHECIIQECDVDTAEIEDEASGDAIATIPRSRSVKCELRQQVETLREQGGVEWLRTWNQMNQTEQSAASLEHENGEVSRLRVEAEGSGCQANDADNDADDGQQPQAMASAAKQLSPINDHKVHSVEIG